MLGDTVSHYRIIEMLGQGGMGEVYLAEDTRLGRKVALKFLAPELARDRESLARFRNEARAVAELSHPNIATIHDLGEVDGKLFLVFEYVRGETLAARLARGPLPIEETIRIGEAIASGLIEAHARGFLHRDVKSSNVMLTEKSEVKILDFGLAHHIDATQLTRPGTALGTVGYMSPEQSTGSSADVRSEIWSTGVVLYECLTGRLPFMGESAPATLHLVQTQSPAPPSGLRTGVPLDLEGVVMRCLEKNPELRYQHVDDLLADLRRVEQRLVTPPEATQAGTTNTRTATPPSRRWLWAAVTLVVVAAGVVGLRLLDRDQRSTPVDEWTLAVMDFEDLTAQTRSPAVAGFMGLLHVGLVEASPTRVLSPDYLRDLRRRSFGESEGFIDVDHALELARRAGAQHMLGGQVLQVEGGYYATWRLVEPRSGKILEAGRTEIGDLIQVVDDVVPRVADLLADETNLRAREEIPSVAAITTHSTRAAMHFAAAQVAAEEGRWSDERQELERAIEIDPDFALAHLRLSQWYDLNDQRRQAFPIARRAWELRSRLGTRDRERVEAYLAVLGERYDRADAVYREILARWPDDLTTLQDLTSLLAYSWCGEYGLPVADAALRLYPDDVVLMRNHLALLRHAGRHELGVEATYEYLERFPKDPTGWYELRWQCLLNGDLDGANAAIERAVALSDGDQQRRYHLEAIYLRSIHTPRDALTELEAMLDDQNLEPSVRRAIWGMLARIHREIGHVRESQRWRERFWATDEGLRGTRPEFDPWLGEFEEILGQSSVVLDDGGRIVPPAKEMPEWDAERSLSFVFHTARRHIEALVCLGRIDEAERLLNELERIVPPTACCDLEHHVRMKRAWICLVRQDPAGALAYLEPTRLAALTEEAAFGHWMMGDMDTAIRRFEAILARGGHRSGGVGLTHYRLARALEQTGRTAEAAGHYERFLDLWRDADEGLVYPGPGPLFGVAPKEDAVRRLTAIRSGTE